jgi:hypothetical protein
MEKCIIVCKDYKEVLKKHHQELMDGIKIISGIDNISEDDEMRSLISEMMGDATHINNCIDSIQTRINRYERLLKKA